MIEFKKRILIVCVVLLIALLGAEKLNFLDRVLYYRIKLEDNPIERIVLLNTSTGMDRGFWAKRYKELIKSSKSDEEKTLLEHLLKE